MYIYVYIYVYVKIKAADVDTLLQLLLYAPFVLLAQRLKALLVQDVAHIYTGTTDVVRGCWFLTPPLRLMLFSNITLLKFHY